MYSIALYLPVAAAQNTLLKHSSGSEIPNLAKLILWDTGALLLLLLLHPQAPQLQDDSVSVIGLPLRSLGRIVPTRTPAVVPRAPTARAIAIWGIVSWFWKYATSGRRRRRKSMETVGRCIQKKNYRKSHHQFSRTTNIRNKSSIIR